MGYSPAAAMLTEQKPPWADQLGVPNCCAHNPLRACIWSRPVKKPSLEGSVARMSSSRAVTTRAAWDWGGRARKGCPVAAGCA